MDVRQLFARYPLDAASSDLLVDTCQALGDAEMAQTLAFLRSRVFGSGRCITFDRTHTAFTLRPYVELALIELRTIADTERWSSRAKDNRAAEVLHAAGFV